MKKPKQLARYGIQHSDVRYLFPITSYQMAPPMPRLQSGVGAFSLLFRGIRNCAAGCAGKLVELQTIKAV